MATDRPTTPSPHLELDHLREYVRDLHAVIDECVTPYTGLRLRSQLSYHQRVKFLVAEIETLKVACLEARRGGRRE